MTFAQLTYVTEVARLGSINKASKATYAMQSTVSNAIQDLEEEVGISIFERTPKGMVLTSDGREFLSFAHSMLESKDMMMRFFRFGKENSVRLNISTQRFAFSIDAFVEYFMNRRSSNYRYRIREVGFMEVVADVRDGVSDIGVIFASDSTHRTIMNLLNSQKLEFIELLHCDSMAMFGPNHPLASQKSVSLKQLSEYPYLAFLNDTNDFASEINLASYRRPANSILVQDRANMYSLLLGTSGYTIGSGVNPKNLPGVRLVSVPIADMSNHVITGLIKSSMKPSTQEAGEFTEILRRMCIDFSSKTENTAGA